jgi:small-conductance mechanosensitive channel
LVPAPVSDWFVAIAVVAGSFLVGLAVDLVVTSALNREVGPAQRARRAVGRALRFQPEIWAVLLGCWIFKPFDFLTGKPQLFAKNALIVLAVLSVTIFLARLAGSLIRAYLSQDNVVAPSATIFVNLARLTIWAIGLTFMLGALGVAIGPLVASLGVVGIAVSLGLQDTLANFFAGLQITLSRQIQPGQYIRLATTQEGVVTDVTWRNTTVRAPSNDLVIIPNSVMATTLITNFTADDEEHTEVVPFSVAFGSNLDTVKRIALDVARSVRDGQEAALDEFEPAVRFRAFGPEGVSAVVTIRVTRYEDRLPVVSDLVERLHRELAAAGIEFGQGLSVAAPKAQ